MPSLSAMAVRSKASEAYAASGGGVLRVPCMQCAERMRQRVQDFADSDAAAGGTATQRRIGTTKISSRKTASGAMSSSAIARFFAFRGLQLGVLEPAG